MNPWFLLFVVSIGAGGFFALLVALSRTPGVSHLFPPDLFYHWLIGHVDLALIMGFLSFLVFLWHDLLKSEAKRHEVFLAYGGTLLVFLSALLGLGTGVSNNYVPTIDHPIFFWGVTLFGVSLLSSSLRFIAPAFRSIKTYRTLGVLVFTSVSLVILFGLTLIVSFLTTPRVEETYLYFERLYWLPGHIHQFVNATLLLMAWVILLREEGYEPPRWLRLLPVAFLPFPVLYSVLQVVTEDTISQSVKLITTLGYAVGIGIPTLIFVFTLLRSVLKIKGFYSRVVLISLLLYTMGALMGYLIAGSDLRIPAHYHGVIASILTALMGLTYHYLKKMGFVSKLPRLIQIQPLLYGFGMTLFVSGLFWAGVYGAPRKTFGTGYIESIKVYVFMLLMGLGSVLSVVGGIMFVLFVLYSIVFRNRASNTG